MGTWSLAVIVLSWVVTATAAMHVGSGQLKASDVSLGAGSIVDPAAGATPTSPSSAAADDQVAPMPIVPGLATAASRQPASVGPASLASDEKSVNVPVNLGGGAIPQLARLAYERAATTETRNSPSCGLSWQILAGIGLIESDHARGGGSGSANWSGVARPAILGPVLDGDHGYPAVKDTDHGVLDADPAFDRAVGPMQFLPATWREYAGTAGATSNPENISDAAGAAGRYLCASGVNLRTPAGLIDAVYGYNHSFNYVANVVSAAQQYADGALPAAAAALAELPALIAGQPTASFVSDSSSSTSSSTTSSTPSATSVRTSAGLPSPGAGLPTAPPSQPTPVPAPLPHPPASAPAPTLPSAGDSTSPTDSASPPDSTSTTDSPTATDSTSPTDVPSSDPSTPTSTTTATLTPTATLAPTSTLSPSSTPAGQPGPTNAGVSAGT